jgi:hypothetical protein
MVIPYTHSTCWRMKSMFYECQHIPKLKLLLILKQSQIWSNARDPWQHKCRPMLKLTKRINLAIPCGLYLPLGAFCRIFFTLSWMVERWNVSSVSLLLSLFLKSIRENMITLILWFLNIRHSDTHFLVCGFSPQFNNCSFSSYPLGAKYVELMGKENGYNSSHVYCHAKGWSKKS